MNKYFLFLAFFLTVSYTIYAQDVFKESYTKLSQFKSDTISNRDFERGNYYLIRGKGNDVKGIYIRSYKNGKKDGKWLEFSKIFGGVNLKNVCTYKLGKKHGYFFYTDNHTITEEGYFKKGKKHGLWKITKVLGGYSITSKGFYKKGKRHGTWTIEEFLYNGNIISKGAYKKDKKHGLWKIKDTSIMIIKDDGSEEPSIINEHYKKGKLIKS